jgi:polysaccharide biosynthesis protein PslH
MTAPIASRNRILWIKADPLYPLDSGGKIRTFQMLKEWHSKNNITYLALLPAGTADAAKSHARSYSSEQVWIPWADQPKGSASFYLALLRNLLFSKYPYVIDKYRNSEAAEKIAGLEQTNNYDVVIADFLSMTLNISLDGIDPAKVIVFQHNVESQIWKRHFLTARNPLLKAYMFVQWRRYRRFEAEMCSKFRGVIAVSEDDANRFREEFGLSNVLGHVPTGVDVDFFEATRYEPEPERIMFLGSMDWMPNIDGIIDFCKTTYPLIRLRCPNVRLTIIGRNPTPAVVALAQQDPSIDVTGTVDDVRPFMAKAAASIVPLRVGGGTRIKIFETMAMGIPVVSSSIGAEGLPVQDSRDIYIADNAELFAERVVTLLQDSAAARTMGAAGQRLVRQRFTWNAAVMQFDEMCRRAITERQLSSERSTSTGRPPNRSLLIN